MKELILISHYFPNTAFANRFLAFAKAYGELGINVKVYIIPLNKKYERVNEVYKNVDFIYLAEKFQFTNKYIRYIIIKLSSLYLFMTLKKDSNVILYSPLDFLWLLSKKRNIHLFHERTEHPEIVGKSNGVLGELRHKRYIKSLIKIDGLFVISPSLKEYFVNEIKLDKGKVHVINMIVDSTRFNGLKSIDKENTISYCGTVSIKKDGILDLINSFSIVANKNRDINLSILGDFENIKTKNIVFKLIDDLSLRDRVIFNGNIDSSLMPKMLSKSKILALARPDSKQAKYGFATKLGEYLLTGVPTVITNVGDFNYYLKDKYDIIFAQPDNVNDFATKLIWVLDNYEESKLIAKNGIDTANKSFNNIIEAQKVIDVIFNNKNI